MSFRNTLAVLNVILLFGTAAGAQPSYEPQALLEVVHKAGESQTGGRNPVVLFDLDDTLINTRERNLRILKDFTDQPDIQENFSSEVAAIQGLNIGQVKFLLADTLKSVGIENQSFIQAASDFWLPRFFSDAYCAKDKSNPGAAQYLHRLIAAGAKIVYLTGRDIPRMHQGTVLNLHRNFFPMSEDHALLLMKPDPKMDDLLFKEQAFAQVKTLGEVVGVFENEPANMNAMSTAFPEATAIFLDTIHSPKPDVPSPGTHWVQDFKLPR